MGLAYKPDSVCYICGQKLNPTQDKGDNSFTVEHIVPKNLGGTNDRANLAAACRRCNQLKSNLGLSKVLVCILIAAKKSQSDKNIPKINKVICLNAKLRDRYTVGFAGHSDALVYVEDNNLFLGVQGDSNAIDMYTCDKYITRMREVFKSDSIFSKPELSRALKVTDKFFNSEFSYVGDDNVSLIKLLSEGEFKMFFAPPPIEALEVQAMLRPGLTVEDVFRERVKELYEEYDKHQMEPVHICAGIRNEQENNKEDKQKFMSNEFFSPTNHPLVIAEPVPTIEDEDDVGFDIGSNTNTQSINLDKIFEDLAKSDQTTSEFKETTTTCFVCGVDCAGTDSSNCVCDYCKGYILDGIPITSEFSSALRTVNAHLKKYSIRE